MEWRAGERARAGPIETQNNRLSWESESPLLLLLRKDEGAHVFGSDLKGMDEWQRLKYNPLLLHDLRKY